MGILISESMPLGMNRFRRLQKFINYEMQVCKIEAIKRIRLVHVHSVIHVSLISVTAFSQILS